MIKQAIILAGGLGTRLRSVVNELPKCMAPVAGKPFLYYVLEYLQTQGIGSYIFSLGYKHEAIEEYVNAEYPTLKVTYAVEEEPLGTGGAIKLACSKATDRNVFVLNGDTIFSVDMQRLGGFHERNNAECTLSLKPMTNFDRYGVVELDGEYNISSFKEKKMYENGMINGGVYALSVANFLQKDLGDKFSFEKNYLEKYYHKKKMVGLVQDEYFIDIGIPEDYEKFQEHVLSVEG